MGGGRARPAAAPRSTAIAVLPFENFSRDPEQAYFSDGLTSEIRTVLARNRQLQVIGSVSSDSFRDKAADLPAIGKALGATVNDVFLACVAGAIRQQLSAKDGVAPPFPLPWRP